MRRHCILLWFTEKNVPALCLQCTKDHGDLTPSTWRWSTLSSASGKQLTFVRILHTPSITSLSCCHRANDINPFAPTQPDCGTPLQLKTKCCRVNAIYTYSHAYIVKFMYIFIGNNPIG